MCEYFKDMWMSNSNKHIVNEEYKSNLNKKVIIYCRESRDDYGENFERIETQRDLLLKFCYENGYKNIVDIIMDDDKSGTDFRRFDNIKERAKRKEFNVIVFKNSSRLGRNQKESLELTQYLEIMGVEIVFEDEKYDEELFGLYAWLNERRARDDSKNIKRNLRHKIEEGELLVKAIYGYNKDGNRLVINCKTAPVVKKIFELSYNGWSNKNIAIYLNEKNIPTPSEARAFKNCKKTKLWNEQHISRILKDERYTGCYIGGFTEKVSFKSKKIRFRDRSEWTIIKNHHEQIIEEKVFFEVQSLRRK